MAEVIRQHSIDDEKQNDVGSTSLDKIVLTPEQIFGKDKIIEALKKVSDIIGLSIISRMFCTYKLPPSVLHLPEVQQAAKTGLMNCLRNGVERMGASTIIDSYQLPADILLLPEVQQASKEGLTVLLKKEPNGSELSEVIDFCKLNQATLQSIEIQQTAKEWLAKFLDRGDFVLSKQIIDLFKLPFEPYLLKSQINFSSWKVFFNFFDVTGNDYYVWIFRDNEGVSNLTQEDLHKIKKLGLTFIEADVLKSCGVDLNEEELGGQKIFLNLKDNKKIPEWCDDQNVKEPFVLGAKIFGYDEMFKYCNRTGLSRHDALHNFSRIIELHRASGLSSEQFYGQILQQVQKDGSSYEAGTAHHQLNNIANNINLDFDATIKKASKYGKIDRMQKLLTDLSSPQDIFSSWKNLKKYADLCDLLGKTEILEQLQELKQQPGKERLYHYIETLAFHPNTDMKAVFQFWREPARFLDIAEIHSPKNHELKKPSNYTNIPNLDLTAENLRDALVEGKIDALQAFEPLEIEYELPVGETLISTEQQTAVDLRTQVKEALGSFKEKIEGKAKNPKKLFAELTGWFKKQNLDFKKYLAGELDVPKELQEQVATIINNAEFGLGQVKASLQETVKYRVKINLKSDPDGVVAGNDTACCMPFGSGKNNVYTFNPVCSLLTIQQEKDDGIWRTVAQSVLTKDKDIKRDIAKVLTQFQSTNKPNIKDVLPPEILQTEKFTMACDNVELTPNVRGNTLTEQQIEILYRDFMYEYLKRYAEKQNLDNKQVIIGKGYSDSLTHLPEVPNTFAPAAPVGYSDKSHSTVYQLVPKEAVDARKQIIDKQKPDLQQELHSQQKGVSLLTFEDAIPVAYIEGKAYESNPTLIQYLHNMENGLIAKDIKNAAAGRPNMSVKYAGADGKIHGYMLAYEGRMREIGGYLDDYGRDNEDMTTSTAEPVIYVSDIASDLAEKGAGHALMLAFLEQYKHFYADRGNFVPIYAQAREQTSYSIIKKNLAKYSQQIGLDLEMEEIGTEQAGSDTMHRIIIRVKR